MLPISRSTNQIKWPLIAIGILFCVGLLFAVTIVLSLIPLYISSKTVTFNIASSPLLNISYNISADELQLTLPIETVPKAALLYLQEKFQNMLDTSSESNDATITVFSASLSGISSARKKRRRQITNEIQLTVAVRIYYPRRCNSGKCKNLVIARIYDAGLAEMGVNFAEFQAAILADETTTTTTITTIITTTNGAWNLYTSTSTATTTNGPWNLYTSTSTATTTNGASNLYTSTSTATTTNGASNIYTSTSTATTTTTIGASNIYTSTISTTVVVTSGGTGSYSPYSSTTPSLGRRRRRSRDISQSTQMSSHMPIGGCLIIAPEKSNVNYKQDMYKQYAFVKHFPFGVESISAVDGQKIDLYTFLRENKLSKNIYNDLVEQDHLVNGHHLTLGALGCLESHVRAWERVIEVNRPMLILEDDVHFQKELIDYILPYLLYSLPTNFSLLYFGNLVGKNMQPKLIDYNDLLWKINGSNWGTYAYLISPQAAATLLDFIYPVHAQVDSMIIDIAQSQSLDVFMSKQILVQTDNTYSRISRTQRYLVPPIVIPRTIHFIWLTNNSLPSIAQRNIEQWKKFHPNWQIKLWTNESIYNSNLTIYNKRRFEHSARGRRQASDTIRYEIIYQYGGIYADVDFEPLKNIEPLLHGVEAFVAYENEYFICNGIFGAIPAHDLTERLVTRLESNWQEHENGTVNEQTGPYHMTRQVKAMEEEKKTGMINRFQMFAPHIFFPYAWYEQDPGHPYDPFAFTVHHYRPIAEIEQDVKERQ